VYHRGDDLFGFLHSKKARTLEHIQAADLSDFVSSRDHLKPKTVLGIVSYVRSFLRFLTMRGILRKDLSAELPKIRVPGMQRFRRCGIRNSSSGFSVRSTAVLRKGSETTPSSYWHAGWVTCWRYSHTETRQPSLGGVDHRNHAKPRRARR